MDAEQKTKLAFIVAAIGLLIFLIARKTKVECDCRARAPQLGVKPPCVPDDTVFGKCPISKTSARAPQLGVEPPWVPDDTVFGRCPSSSSAQRQVVLASNLVLGKVNRHA